jgi:trk system potassium uptake protein TrkA
MKIIILGCGRVGATLAAMMTRQGHEVTIIDQKSEAFERLADFKDKVRTFVGDGIDEDVLRAADIETADAFAAVTNGDNRNIMAAQIASQIFHVERVICRIYDPIRQESYRSLGLESISPTVVGAKLLRDKLLGPTADASSAALARSGAAPEAADRAPKPGTPTVAATPPSRASAAPSAKGGPSTGTAAAAPPANGTGAPPARSLPLASPARRDLDPRRRPSQPTPPPRGR